MTSKNFASCFIVTLTFNLEVQGHVWLTPYPQYLENIQKISYISEDYGYKQNHEKSHFLLMTSL